MYISPHEGGIIPVVLYPFPQKRAVILDGIEAAYRATKNRGIWIADREYDNKRVLDRLIDHKRAFVIRVRIDPRVSRDII